MGDPVVAAEAHSPEGIECLIREFETYRSLQSGLAEITFARNVKCRRGDAVSHLAYSAAGTKLATASLDRTVRLWDLSVGAPTRIFENSAPVLCLAITADCTNVASGKTDGSVTLTALQEF